VPGLDDSTVYGPVAYNRISYDSPAIDNAPLDSCPAIDQRGRPRPSGHGCDIGSFEFQFVGVGKDGDDENTGLPGDPLLTLGAALDTHPDLIVLGEGAFEVEYETDFANIVGQGRELTTISNAGEGRILTISPEGGLFLSDLRVEPSGNHEGGCIRGQEGSRVTLENVDLIGCRVSDNDYGGAILTQGSVLLQSSSIVGGEGAEAGWGGGIAAPESDHISIDIRDSELLELDAVHQGGAVWSTSGYVRLSGTEVRECSAPDGGAIWHDAHWIVRNSTFADNLATGSIIDGSEADIVISESSLYDNQAASTLRAPTMWIYQCTFSNNSGVGVQCPDYSCGAIPCAFCHIESTTLVGDDTLLSVSTGELRLLASIVNGGEDTPACEGEINSLGNNIENRDSCNLQGDGDMSDTDPLLLTLQDNGGPTLTHEPASESPAIDAAEEDCGSSASGADQRGVLRSLPCDIGAVERVAE
ncbi:MAG: hypothetical protein KC561_09805, partial [Myxococcales bacterium]|nr:hypothetical protein [Myxococcales bacterium]